MAAGRSRNSIPERMWQLSERAFRGVQRTPGPGPQFVTPLRGLRLVRQHLCTEFESTIYEPLLCLILQGRKETTFGGRTFPMGAGECLLVSHDLPVISRIVETPYRALLLDVEIDTLRSLHDDLRASPPDGAEDRPLQVHTATSLLIDALERYLALAGSATDAKVLGPMISKEIHYRLLMGPAGGMLRNLIRYDSHAALVSRAITLIRRDFRSSIVIAELAREVGMSVSSFHRHFKAVTSVSPLQYQKELRLLEARRILMAGTASVSTTAFEVGYESLSQFSREYSRKFGNSPSTDLAGK